MPGSEHTESNLPTDDRILDGRFLVMRDLTDPTLGGRFSSYLVRDLQDSRSEAVLKTVAPGPKEINVGPSFLEVCKVIAGLGHPNVEEILETGFLSNGAPYALAHRYHGIRLAEIIGDENVLELPRVAAIVEQIADALAAAHARNVLHCDVVPDNVLMTFGEDGRESVRVINFGEAWPVDARGEALENVRPSCTSFVYAAPELHNKLGHRSTVSDVYSLGVLAYRLITGHLPFEGTDRASLLRSIHSARLAAPTLFRPDLSGEAENLLRAALEFEPAARPRGVGGFGASLVNSLMAEGRIHSYVPDSVYETSPVAAAVTVGSLSSEHVPARTGSQPVQNEAKADPPVSDWAAAWTLIVLLLAGAMSIPIGQTLMAEEKTESSTVAPQSKTTAAVPKRTIKYWFAGSEASGSKNDLPNKQDRLLLNAEAPGQVFIFSESNDAEGRTSYKLIYPLAGDGQVEAEKLVETGVAVRGGEEKLWLVWTTVSNAELDELRNGADASGLVSEDHARKLRHLLERNRDLNITVTRDVSTGQTVLTGSSERMVHRIEANQS